jgi:hypothetical protein
MSRCRQVAVCATNFSQSAAPAFVARLSQSAAPAFVARLSQSAAAPFAAKLSRGAALAVSLLALTASSAYAAGSQTLSVSVTPNGGFADPGTGATPSISDDGRYVVFTSAAENLFTAAAPDLGGVTPAGVREVYLKDLDTGRLALVSRADGTGGQAANEPNGGEGIGRAIISGDGRYAIFASYAGNLVSGLPEEEPGEELHVYRRDLQSGETVLVDRVTGANGTILSREARAEAISDDGRYVVFGAAVGDLEDPAGEHEWAESNAQTVYVRDMQTGTTTAVSRAAGVAGETANKSSTATSISPDGRFVAFQSSATNLALGSSPNGSRQVYLRDLQDATTTLVSQGPNGEVGDEASAEGTLLGADGCKVAFESAATNVFPQAQAAAPQIYLRDLCATPASTTLLSRANGEGGAPVGAGDSENPPSVLGSSANGSEAIFAASLQTLEGSARHLYLRDPLSGQTTLLDRAGGAEGAIADGDVEQAAISANGCRVAFATTATNLSATPPPTNGHPSEIYVRELAPCAAVTQPIEAGHTKPTEDLTGISGEGGAHGSAGAGNPGGDGGGGNGGSSTNSSASSTGAVCVVPAMRGLGLAAVRRVLRSAHCTLGHVARHYSKLPRGRLVEQSLHQTTIRPAGTRVNVWLSRGRHPRSTRRRP